jgi:AraC-like DNA-binding protein
MAQSFSFSTIQLPGARSIEAWQEAMAEVYYRLDIRSDHNERLNGQLIDWQSDIMGISSFKADAQRVTRSKEAAKADKAEDFVFLFPTRKPMRFQQRGREDMVRPGSVFLVNSAEPYVIDVPDGSENITIKIRRENLLPRFRTLDDLCGTAHFANPHLIPAVMTLGEQMLRLKPDGDEPKIAQTLTDLICLMLELGQQSGVPPLTRPELSSLLFSRICAYIQAQLGSHDLTPEYVASAHRISVRYLHKLFQANGLSFGQYVLDARLQRARQMILSGDGHGRINMGELAYRCGFASQSHFSASYKTRFGVTPTGSKPLLDAEREASKTDHTS